jgi:K+-transporting ATPase ATPase C chain
MSGRAVEAAGDVNTLLLDKTGTITLGNRQASEFVPLPGVTADQLADAAPLASLADETPEGQPFVDAKGNPLRRWFQPRPSAAADASNSNDPGYNPLFSGASNLGPTNPDLIKKINDRRAAVAAFDGVAPGDVPPDAVTASASGLDPDISPAYAYLQTNRVATARGLNPAAVRALVTDHIQNRVLGILGEPRVNVVELNLALDALGGAR